MSLRKNIRERKQADLTTFTTVTTKPRLTANEKVMDAKASTASVATNSETTNVSYNADAEKQHETHQESEVTLGNIMTAINAMKNDLSSMKDDFTSKLDGIRAAMEGVKAEVAECTNRVTLAETRISTTEDDVNVLRNKVKHLEGRNKYMEEKILDLEVRSRSSNVRMINLPEGAEGSDACSFLEQWLPEALGIAPLREKLTVEKAHRLGSRVGRAADSAPRTLIMKFLSHRDKERVMRASRNKRQILYKDQAVQFFQDLPTETHRKKKEFGEARRQLRQMGLRYGMIPPARLIVTYKNRSYIFNSVEEAEAFIQKTQVDNQEN